MGSSSDQKLRDKNNSQSVDQRIEANKYNRQQCDRTNFDMVLALLSNTDAADIFRCSRNDVDILKVGIENSPSGSVASILVRYEVRRRSKVEHVGESFVLAVLILNIKKHVVSNVSEI